MTIQSLRQQKKVEALGTRRGVVSLVAALTLAGIVACSSSSGSSLPCCVLGSPDADSDGENCQCATADAGPGADVSCVIHGGANGSCSVECTEVTPSGTSTLTFNGGTQAPSCPK